MHSSDYLFAFVHFQCAHQVEVNMSTEDRLKVMISGAPASGKGTQCELIKKKVGERFYFFFSVYLLNSTDVADIVTLLIGYDFNLSSTNLSWR